MRTEALKDLIKHLELYAHDENFKWYDYYAIPCREEILYDEAYHNLDTNMTIEVFKEYDFINILGLTIEELEYIEYVLHIYIYFKGGER